VALGTKAGARSRRGDARAPGRFALATLRSRALREGLLGGNRRWLAIGALTWSVRLVHLAVQRRPETLWRGRIRKGEGLIVVEHPPGWRPGRP
jgi:hypothetical protein